MHSDGIESSAGPDLLEVIVLKIALWPMATAQRS